MNILKYFILIENETVSVNSPWKVLDFTVTSYLHPSLPLGKIKNAPAKHKTGETVKISLFFIFTGV